MRKCKQNGKEKAEDYCMKIKDGFLLRKIAGANIAVPIGERIAEFNGTITLRGISAQIWELLEEDRTFEDLLAHILSIYDVDEETAKNDLKKTIEQLESNGLLEQ